jgi:hypothetical protein
MTDKLVKGFSKTTATHETIFAVFPDGRVYAATIEGRTPFFTTSDRNWQPVDKVADGAAFIGNYPEPKISDPVAEMRAFIANATLAQAIAEGWTELRPLPFGFRGFEHPTLGEDGPVIVFDDKGEVHGPYECMDEAEDDIEASQMF